MGGWDLTAVVNSPCPSFVMPSNSEFHGEIFAVFCIQVAGSGCNFGEVAVP
jgi:hypothetical protein